MRLAVLGGSFNPIHMGHLFLADTVLTALGYDRVILIPAFQSPFKIGAEAASPEDRMAMLAASISGDPRLIIDDCEIRRGGVSFTIDTLEDIIDRFRPEGKPGLILGDDLASAFDKWRKPAEIAELADIIIARRLTGKEKGAGEPHFSEAASGCPSAADSGPAAAIPGGFPYPCKVLDNEIMDVSSRMVREKIHRGENWRYLVPPGARYIIEDRSLYGFAAQAGGGSLTETIVRIENDLRTVLSFDRFLHSRNTALLSWDLCRRFGLDPQKGYLAGISHDICKELRVEELFHLAHADGGSISKLEQKKPGLLHARAAAVLIKRKYNITDKDILDAVRSHITGTRDMGPLAKIVYIADKIEFSRIRIDPVLRGLRDMKEKSDLETLFAAVLNSNVAYLKSREVDISYGTRRLLAAMQKRNNS